MAENRTPTAEKLAAAMTEAGCPSAMIEKARTGYYDDFKSPLPCPYIQLVEDLAPFPTLHARAKQGEFDGQVWEADEWAASPEGREVLEQLGPIAEALGLK